MTNIFERTATALAGLGVPCAMGEYRANNLNPPDVYITYTLISSPPLQHADDAETMRFYRMQVSIFHLSNELPDVDGVMLAAGFQKGGQRALPPDEQTRHFGLATDYIYQEGV